MSAARRHSAAGGVGIYRRQARLSLMPPPEQIGSGAAGSVLGEIENVVGIGVDHSAGNSRRLDAPADHV